MLSLLAQLPGSHSEQLVMGNHLHPLHGACNEVLASHCSLKPILPIGIYQSQCPTQAAHTIKNSHMYTPFLRSQMFPCIHDFPTLYEHFQRCLGAQWAQGMVRARGDGHSPMSWVVRHYLYFLRRGAEMVSRCSFRRKSLKSAGLV